MTRHVKISPSMMCADLSQLGAQLRILDDVGVDVFHFDIMDGHFVPNLALSPMIIRSLRPLSRTPFDVHLMVENPVMYLGELYEIGVDMITVHIESLGNNAFRILKEIRSHGCRAGVAMNPVTPICMLEYVLDEVDKVTVMTVDPGFAGQPFVVQMLEKVRALDITRRERGYRFDIEVDGSINAATISQVLEAGADILVVGTSGLFGLGRDLAENLSELKAVVAGRHLDLGSSPGGGEVSPPAGPGG